MLQCELSNFQKCDFSLMDHLSKQNYDCKFKGKIVFFNQEFDAIGFAYQAEKPNLLKFIAKNIAFFSLDDPDFLNYFLYSNSFKAKLYGDVVLTTL